MARGKVTVAGGTVIARLGTVIGGVGSGTGTSVSRPASSVGPAAGTIVSPFTLGPSVPVGTGATTGAVGAGGAAVSHARKTNPMCSNK